MVKIHDQTAAFASVVSSRRRSLANDAGERFRLGLHGLDCGPASRPETRSAVIGASAWALKPEQVDRTSELIGMAGGLLTDLGFSVCPIGADGRVADARVIRSIPLLDGAALDSVRQWEFTPTLLNGVPTAIIMSATVNFAL